MRFVRLVASFAVVAGCTASRPPAPGDTESGLPPPPSGGFGGPVTVHFDGAPALRVEVASRPDQRQRGLMQRRSLPENTGMIFVFPGRTTSSFYMRGTLLPLSIAYVDGTVVVSTAEMAPCPPGTEDCPTYPPAGPYTVAVEAPAGFFPRYGVRTGTRMRIEGALPDAS